MLDSQFFYPLTLISTPKPVRALPVNRYDAAFASSGWDATQGTPTT